MKISDKQIDGVFDLLPCGAMGFLKYWGYRDFARRILAMRAVPQWEPEFDAVSPTQEKLAAEFSEELGGVDPVRLLEMAQELYKAEMTDKLGLDIIEGGK